MPDLAFYFDICFCLSTFYAQFILNLDIFMHLVLNSTDEKLSLVYLYQNKCLFHLIHLILNVYYQQRRKKLCTSLGQSLSLFV